MLKEKLDNAPNLMQVSRKMSSARLEEVNNHNSAIYSDIISEAFNGRNVAVFISPASFWVYAQSIEEAEDIKMLAMQFGYFNMHTLEPFVSEDGTNRKADPNGKYAVNISSSNELIIGDTAKSFDALLTKMLEPKVLSEVLFKHGHSGRFTLYFSELDKAETVKTAFDKVFTAVEKIVPMSISVKITKHYRDYFGVHFDCKVKD